MADDTVSRKRPATDDVADNEDKLYFESYESLHVHEDMLRDRARTDAYRHALAAWQGALKDKIVLDVGGGTGILSMFAAKDGGARRVYCIEASGIVSLTRQAIAANGLSDVVEVVHGRVEDVALPEQVDVIVSEWMGYGLLYEGMLESVLLARDRWLKPGGLLLPDKAALFTALLTNEAFYEDRLQFWESTQSTYGVDLAVFGYGHAASRQAILRHPIEAVVVDPVGPENVMSWPTKFAELDLHTITAADLEAIRGTFDLTAMISGPFHGLLLWFEVSFPVPDSAEAITLSTSPYAPETHWKQCQLLTHMPAGVHLEQDSRVRGSLCLRKRPGRRRELLVDIAYDGAYDDSISAGVPASTHQLSLTSGT